MAKQGHNMKKLYCLLIVISVFITIHIFPAEKDMSLTTILPSDIVKELVIQIIATSDTRSEAFETLINFARTDKVLLSYLTNKNNIKEIESFLDIKFELDTLATGIYEDSIIQKKTLEIVTSALKNNLYSEEIQQQTLQLLSDKVKNKAPSLKLELILTIINLLNNAIEIKDYKLAAVLLGVINRYARDAYDVIPEDKRLNSFALNLDIDNLIFVTKNFISKLPESLTIAQIQILNLLYVIGSYVYEDKFTDAINKMVQETNNSDVKKYYYGPQ